MDILIWMAYFDSLQRNGWAFIKNGVSESVLNQAFKVCEGAINDKKHWDNISGGYKQYDLSKWGAKNKEILALHKHIEYATQKACQLTDKVAKHFKLLAVEPGVGPQAPHRDGLSKNQYVVALYLTNNQTTDVCSLAYPLVDLSETSHDDLKKLDPEYWNQFYHFDTTPGDMMVFAEDVVHRGIKNISNATRYVLFTVMGPDDDHSDEYQHFEWSWAEDLYGFASPQHIASLVKNQQYNPLAYESNLKKRYTLAKLMKNYSQTN